MTNAFGIYLFYGKKGNLLLRGVFLSFSCMLLSALKSHSEKFIDVGQNIEESE